MFNNFAKQLGMATALLLSVGFGTTTAQAASVQASAVLTGFTSTGVTLSNDYYTQDAQTSLTSGTFHTGTTTQDIIVGSSPSAESSYSQFGAPLTTAGVIGSGWASSMFQWSFDYTATTTGVATFDFEYLYDVTISNLLPGEKAGGSSSINAFVDGTVISNDFFKYYVNQNIVDNGFDNLVLSLNVTQGQKGTITFTAGSQVYANAVPVPAAVWLFGSALTGMVGLRRRNA